MAAVRRMRLSWRWRPRDGPRPPGGRRCRKVRLSPGRRRCRGRSLLEAAPETLTVFAGTGDSVLVEVSLDNPVAEAERGTARPASVRGPARCCPRQSARLPGVPATDTFSLNSTSMSMSSPIAYQRSVPAELTMLMEATEGAVVSTLCPESIAQTRVCPRCRIAGDVLHAGTQQGWQGPRLRWCRRHHRQRCR